MKVFCTEHYRCLELLVRTGEEKEGKVKLLKGGKREFEKTIKADNKKWLKIPVEQKTTYELKHEFIDIGIAYLSECDDIIEKGVKYLVINQEDRSEVSLEKHYDTPLRDQYHFMPFMNWLNDPNGLCWFQGRYHLFYQANPFEQKWDDMYWGHAVSKDLIHWCHLPFVLEPQEKIQNNLRWSGGAFSGCAFPRDDEVYFFLTRHEQIRGDDSTVSEWQTMMKSSDLMNFSEESVIIQEQPVGAGCDFRDPKVSEFNGMYYMVLASNMDQQLAMLLYSSENLTDWKYEKPLVTDKEEGATTYECPDFFKLDGKYVAMAALMKYVDEYGRYQMSRYYIGEFENNQLRVEQTGWLDFGGDFYAVQTFLKDEKRIAIGWISDFHDEHIEVPYGSKGGFAIPRVLSIQNNMLYMEPVPYVYKLKKELIYIGIDKQVQISNIVGNIYYAELNFKENTNFNILLGKNGQCEIRLLYENGIAEIKTFGVKSERTRFPVEVARLEHIEIFVDRRTIEVYINRGYAAGTKLFLNENKQGIFEAFFEKETAVSKIELHSMQSIWT